jgi:hypothetical protein
MKDKRKQRKERPGVVELFGQTDLPPGRVFGCYHCGTRLKEGQPHTALRPYPHQSLTTLVKTEKLTDELDGYVMGSLLGITGYRPQLIAPAHPKKVPAGHGRIIEGVLVQDPVSLLWHEVKA